MINRCRQTHLRLIKRHDYCDSRQPPINHRRGIIRECLAKLREPTIRDVRSAVIDAPTKSFFSKFFSRDFGDGLAFFRGLGVIGCEGEVVEVIFLS